MSDPAQKPMPVRVLLADDQRLVRESLGTLLGLLPGIEMVASASDGEEALALAEEHSPDVVLMDLRMPRLDGIEARPGPFNCILPGRIREDAPVRLGETYGKASKSRLT